jgi:hypothetical protein
MPVILHAASAALAALALLAPAAAAQEVTVLDTQIQYNRGQNVAPLYEGWIRNPDGTVDMWFGYLNKNYEEVLHVPVGPANSIQPGGPVGRRENYVFRVTVPADFGEEDEVVWTVTANGRTDQAVGTLLDVYALEGPPEGNTPPTVSLSADRTSVDTGDAVNLSATISDDGLPESGRARANVRWQRYRGPGTVRFDPPRSSFPEEPGAISDIELGSSATFSSPGTYMLRAAVNDGDVNPAGWPRVPSTTFASVTIEVRPD